MEPLSLSFSLAFVSFSISLAIIFTFTQFRGDKNNVKLPPGSFGWPIIGESIEFLFGNPEKFVNYRMKKYSPDIFKTKIFGEKTAVICGHAGHKFLFMNEQKLFTTFRPLSTQRMFRTHLYTMPINESKDVRQPGFLKPEALRQYLGTMDTITEELLQAHCKGKDDVKASPLASTITLTLACRFFLGIENPGRISRLVKHFDDVTLGMHSIIVNLPGTTFYRGIKAADAIRKEIKVVINEKKAEMASGKQIMRDILSHMIVSTDPNGRFLAEEEIADRILGLLVAGYSNVASTITFFMKYVGERPEIYNMIRKEQMEIVATKKPGESLDWKDVQKMKYSWNVVSEAMRLTPPIQGTFREVVTDFDYAGYTIPKGWKVYWTVSSTHMNPEYFRDPGKFDPSRHEKGEGYVPYTYVPFGGGPRVCPGQEYARVVILTFVHNVVKKYSWEVVNPDEKIIGDMSPSSEKGLPIRLHPI